MLLYQIRTILLIALFTAPSIIRAQVYIPGYGNVVSQVSQNNILDDLEQFESFGIKYRGTAAQANTLQWLKDKYSSFGYTAGQIVEDPFTYAGSTCKNLVVTKTGTLYPNTFVIVCGHYDTINGPGTNDNGSGVSVILEIARLLQSIPTEYSIKFINFSGEEDGLIGSQHYVNEIVNGTNMDIRLVLNLDQVGGVAGETNNTITCERDQSNSPSSNNAASNTMTTQLRNCMELYSPLNTVISVAYGSDYVPFEDNGEVITGLYEYNESPFPHTSNDLLENMDPVFVYQVAQGATGAVMHFAVACTTCGLGNADADTEKVYIHPIPARESIYLNMPMSIIRSYSISDITGKVVVDDSLENNSHEHQIPVADLKAGIYFITIQTDHGSILRRIIIE